MTAEIALLNRRAIAFAADSAVTISDGVSEKIYNSAEKIFEISKCSPMGLMVYNAMEFVGAPIDVLAREFRDHYKKKFLSCEQACKEFLAFLLHYKRTSEDEFEHLERVLSEEYSDVIKSYRVQSRDALNKWFAKNPTQMPDLDKLRKDLIISIIEDHSNTHAKRPLKDFLDGVNLSDFSTQYGPYALKVARRMFSGMPFDSDVEFKIIELSFNAIRSDVLSDALTGLIFGGFGASELFPSLYAVEIDGIYFDQVKWKYYHSVDIDRRGDRAAIIPFAQSEMVERFLFSIDPEIEKGILDFITASSGKAVRKLKSAGVDVGTMGLDAKTYAGDVNKLLARLKENSRAETLEMVDFMPKQELAYAAEAFISLTSVKRKVSAQQETVGGPIDVAIITKNEGFVWIKRKLYFDSGLNPSYFVRASRER